MKKTKLVIILLFTIILFGCQEKKLLLVPDNLVGIWKTTESRYADRSFEFTHSAIIFGIGEGEFERYTIDYLKMKRTRDGKSTIYTIFYHDQEGEEYILTFYYYPEKNGVIKVKYQENTVWTKEKDT